jgi:hypothetical protein
MFVGVSNFATTVATDSVTVKLSTGAGAFNVNCVEESEN